MNPDRMELGGNWNDWAGYHNPESGHNLRSAARTGVERNSADDHSGIRIGIDYIERSY